MRQIFYFTFLFFLFWSCDTRKDIFQIPIEKASFDLVLNSKKKLTVSVNEMVRDSAKQNASAYHNGKNYCLEYTLNATKNSSLVAQIKKPNAAVLEKKAIDKQGNLCFLLEELGDYTLSLEVADTYGESALLVLKINVFEGVSPEVNFELKDLGGGLLRIDASKTIDHEAAYGGGIQQYHFRIHSEWEELIPIIQFNPLLEKKLNIIEENYIVHVKACTENKCSLEKEKQIKLN